MLKHGILGLLNYGTMTGYEIMTVFRDSLHFFWSAQTSQIYRELQGLEEQGWVDKTPVAQQGKPDKKLYAITPAGREELRRWLAGSPPVLDFRSPLLMRVFFLGEQSREDNIRYFTQLQAFCREFLQSMDTAQAHVGEYRAVLDDPGKAAYWEMTVDYGRRNMEMCLEWIQSCLDRLKEEK